MKIGILGLGPVGRSFLETLPQYGEHTFYVYDTDPDKSRNLGRGVYLCRGEEEVGGEADFLLCCTDMLSGHALTKAAGAMRSGAVVSGDFSAKTPEYEAVRASGRLEDLAYWSIHTMFAPATGFDGQLVIEIPVRNCTDGGSEHPYISGFRETMGRAGARFKRIWSYQDHDRRMGRIQGATSAENICTARTLAELGINPAKADEGPYANRFDEIKFLMALRSIGKAGSSNPRVYGLIAMMNPYSLDNLRSYELALEKLILAAGRSEAEANAMLAEAVESLGFERVAAARRLWEEKFGPFPDSGNSYSSHLAEAVLWSGSEYPLEIFDETPSPPYMMRGLQALTAASDYERCIRNMASGGTHDGDFLRFVRQKREWAEGAVAAVRSDPKTGWEQIDGYEQLFFTPVRKAFPEELESVGPATNEILRELMRQ